LNFIEIFSARIRVQTGHRLFHCRQDPLKRYVFNSGPVFFPTGDKINPLYKTIHGYGCLFSGRHSLHNGSRSADGIATRKDIGIVRLQGRRIHIEGPPCTQCAGALIGQTGPIALLTDGRNDRIHIEDEFGTLNRDGPASAAFIRFPELHLDALQTADTSIFADDPYRAGECHDFDTLFTALLDLHLVGRHLGKASPVDDKGF